MILDIQKEYRESSIKNMKEFAKRYSISIPTVSRYVNMPKDKIDALNFPPNKKKRKTVMDNYLNIIYKMLRDKIKPEIILSYVIKKGYAGNLKTLENYIGLISKNNFNVWLHRDFGYDYSYSDDVTVISRREVLKYITTKNPKMKTNNLVVKNFKIITNKYAIVTVLKEIYDEFYNILSSGISDNLDSFIIKYKKSIISGFADGLLDDIKAVKNAITHKESNGFVEGNNNKFKLIKRILYGRANLDTLFKKSYLAFKVNKKDFDLSQLL